MGKLNRGIDVNKFIHLQKINCHWLKQFPWWSVPILKPYQSTQIKMDIRLRGRFRLRKGKKRKKHKLKKGKQVQHGSKQGDLLNTFSIVFTLLRKTVLLPRQQIFTLIA